MQTDRPHDRKIDRRTRYTQSAIKDALLELLEEQPYEKITVASLCRRSEITRATFYLHYDSLDMVLDELLDEALMVVEESIRSMSVMNRYTDLEQLIQSGGDWRELRKNEHLLSPCQRIADAPKYRAIFQDPTLSNYVINKVYMMERGEIIDYLTDRCSLSRDEADKLFMLLVHGLFYMNRALKWNKDSSWYEMQLLVARFMFGGFKELE